MNLHQSSFSHLLLAALMLAVWMLTGCAGGSKPGIAQSKLERITTPNIDTETLAALADGNNTFALDFYHQARHNQDGNLIASPYSLSLALAMAYGGARGQTAQQMADVLHFSLPSEQLHPAFNALDLRLATPAAANQPDDHPRLYLANSLWLQKDFKILPAYLDLLAQHYGAGLHTADFARATETVRRAINDWISRETQDKIQNILPEGSLDPNTRLLLANAIYFKAKWQQPFSTSKTHDAPFTLLNGSQVTVTMMSVFQAEYLPYARGDGYLAVALPYQDSTIAMILLVPDADRFAEFEVALTWPKLKYLLATLQPANVDLALPKFDFETTYQLNQTLSDLGMTDAFDPTIADFSGITGGRDLFIGDVRHKAFIAVDEIGTEAAAATIVAFPVAKVPTEVELTIDRPFLFAIQDRATGAILFLGRVLQP